MKKRLAHYSSARRLQSTKGRLGIIVRLDTVIFGAIGFMRIRNKSGGTLFNPDFHSPETWS